MEGYMAVVNPFSRFLLVHAHGTFSEAPEAFLPSAFAEVAEP